MSSLSDRIDDYAALPPDDRAAVERDVAASGTPADAARLAEARALAALLDAAAGADPARPVSRDDVATYVADRALGLAPADAERIEAALRTDADLRAHADHVRERMARLAAPRAATESPDARFERLTGQTLTPDGPADSVAPVALRSPDRTARPADRAAAAPPRASRVSTGRRVLVLAAAVLVAYGGLAIGSAAQRTERDRLIDLDDLATYAPMQVRGGETDSLAERLDVALDGVAEARRTTLGLFPRYDDAALDGVAGQLAAISAEANSGSAVSQEARFALARIRLEQNRDAEAVRLLGALVREQSYRASEARRLLDAVR